MVGFHDGKSCFWHGITKFHAGGPDSGMMRDFDDMMRFGVCSIKVAVGYVRTTDCERSKPILDGELRP